MPNYGTPRTQFYESLLQYKETDGPLLDCLGIKPYDKKNIDNLGRNWTTGCLICARGQDVLGSFVDVNNVACFKTQIKNFLTIYQQDKASKINDWWLSEDNYIRANFEYQIVNNEIHFEFLYRFHLTGSRYLGYLLKEYYLKKYSAIVSEDLLTHTTFYEKNKWLVIIDYFTQNKINI